MVVVERLSSAILSSTVCGIVVVGMTSSFSWTGLASGSGFSISISVGIKLAKVVGLSAISSESSSSSLSSFKIFGNLVSNCWITLSKIEFIICSMFSWSTSTSVTEVGFIVVTSSFKSFMIPLGSINPLITNNHYFESRFTSFNFLW